MFYGLMRLFLFSMFRAVVFRLDWCGVFNTQMCMLVVLATCETLTLIYCLFADFKLQIGKVHNGQKTRTLLFNV